MDHIQTILARTNDGKSVTLFPDGTWKYSLNEIEKSRTLIEEHLIKHEDRISGRSYLVNKAPITILSNGIEATTSILLLGDKRDKISLNFTINNKIVCVDENNSITILFTDSSRHVAKNKSEYNCESTFTLYMGGVFGHLDLREILRSKDIEAIRFSTRTDVIDVYFSIENACNLRNVIDSMANSEIN